MRGTRAKSRDARVVSCSLGKAHALVVRCIGLWALCGGALLVVIVVATAINAAGFAANMVARLWGGSVSGLPGYEDAVTMLVGVAALAMFPYCQLHGGHAVVDMFMQKAPGWVNRGVDVVSALLMAAVGALMAAMLVLGTIEMRADNTETPVLAWPVWIFMPAGVVSCALWALAALLPILVAPDADDKARDEP